jgi:signal transduction histidine kinase
MKKTPFISHLNLFFVFAVVIPCVFLAVMAIRSINREEAYIEKRLQSALQAELTHVANLVNTELENIRNELQTAIPADVKQDPQSALSVWAERSLLVKVPFLLSPEFEILWPRYHPRSSDEELAFLNWNRDFITNRARIPVYQNIAVAYMDRITKPKWRNVRSEELMASDQAQAPPEPTESRTGGAKLSKSRYESQKIQTQQRAISEFTKDEQIRKDLYGKAREEGQKPLVRNVLPSAGASQDKFLEQKESIYISEAKRFSEITAEGETGIIPRFIEEKLSLLFWKKESVNWIVGCVVDEEVFKARILSLLPDIYSSERVLTVLDENGRPLITPGDTEQRDWRRPFVAREISEILPRWEVVAYLADPDFITSRANSTAVIMWVLILLFFLSIVSGGTYVLRKLRSEVVLASQKTSFVANVSHELKTPLTSIRMFAEMLKEKRQSDPKKQQKYLSIMVSETERLTRLINNVLDFVRMEKNQKQYDLKKLDLALVSEDLIESQRVRLEHNGFEMIFRNCAGEAFINGDEEALKQAVLNLLSNAEKYSGTKKKIEVEINHMEKNVFIDIKDRGIGIPPQHVKKIFKEFFRVDETLTAGAGGSGLGLTIAQKIVHDLGGNIQYFPRSGGGSIFRMIFPMQI